VAVACTTVIWLAAADGVGTADGRAIAAERAASSYAAMQRYYASPGGGAYTESYPAGGPARAWPYSQVLAATVDMQHIGRASSNDVAKRIAGLSAYDGGEGYAPVFGARGNLFYDDNLWIALALDRASSRPPTVVKLFGLVARGWDPDASQRCAGGVFWTRDPSIRDRNAVTTANAALLGIRLYERARVRRFLAFAQRAYAWADRCLARDDGLIADHIRADGSVDWTAWSYNQGAMIATAVHLYGATRDRTYLREAEQRADATLAHLGDPVAAGEPAAFLAIFYRDLLELTKLEPDRADRAAVRRFADEAWLRRRDPKTGLFRFGRTPTLLDQAAMVQVYAALAAA
jgi:predicted alpha-1,6-mannanase (GH76 family)